MGASEKASREQTAEEALRALLETMATLRAPGGCPWDREQDHESLRYHAVEEVYELMDAVEAGDDTAMVEELGDLLLQVVFHAQVAYEREAFDFAAVARVIVEKLVRRHPHVFGDSDAKDIDSVWAQWERIKHEEKVGTEQERRSPLEGIPKHLPALMQAEKLIKKARKADLLREEDRSGHPAVAAATPEGLGKQLFALVWQAQEQGWSAEELLRQETESRRRAWAARESAEHRSSG